jgi:putative acetyltransferase
MKNQVYSGGQDDLVIQLFTQTFSDSEGEKEGKLIGELVHNLLESTPKQDLRVFISSEMDELTACIIFTNLRFENHDRNVWLLSPVAVRTAFQGKGVGQALIRFAHESLQCEGVQLVVTYGDINFYSKVGYAPITEDVIQPPLPLSSPEGWIAQSLGGTDIVPIKGKSYCVDAFNNPAYW